VATHSVFEPSVLHISRNEWHDGDLVARFEQRWMDLIDALSDAESAGYDLRGIVSYAIESLIWGTDTAPAWATDRDARQRLLPVFQQRLRPLMDAVDVGQASDTRTEPAIDDRAPDDPWLKATLDLLCWAAGQPDDLVIEVGVNGTMATSAELMTTGNPARTAPMCHGYGEFLSLLPVDALLRAADARQLPKVLNLAVRRFVHENPEREQLYALECSPAFVEQCVSAGNDMKPLIADTIASRLTQTQKSAQAEKGLKDEPLGGRDNWRRCRVSRGWRIHYSYPGPKAIRLETVGPHDMGL
jgi:hypothetical protein